MGGRRDGGAVLALAAALVLTSCSSSGGRHPAAGGTPSVGASTAGPAAPLDDYVGYGPTRGTGFDLHKVAAHGVRALNPKTAKIVGTDFEVTFDQVGTVTRLDAGQQRTLTLPDDDPGTPSTLTASPGHEFLLTKVGMPINFQTVRGDSPVTWTIRVGGETRATPSNWDFVSSPDLFSVLVVAVPVGADALLVATEDGHAQTVSLRTGRPGANPWSAAPLADKFAYFTSVMLVTQPGVRFQTMGLPVDEFSYELQVFATVQLNVAGHPTAPAGRAWLVVRVDATLSDDTHVGADIDLDKVLKLGTPAGALRIPAESLASLSGTNPDYAAGHATVIFDVPRSLHTLSATVAFGGKVFDKTSGDPVRWRFLAGRQVHQTIAMTVRS